MEILTHACGGFEITTSKYRGHGVRQSGMPQRQRNPRAGTAGRTPTHRVDHHHHGAAMWPKHGVHGLGVRVSCTPRRVSSCRIGPINSSGYLMASCLLNQCVALVQTTDGNRVYSITTMVLGSRRA